MPIQPTVRRTMVIISTVVLAVLLLASSVRAVSPLDADTDTVEYTVAAGDTLWAIADRVADPGDDLRAVVGDIQQLNNLQGSLIHPGQTLLVPAG